MPTLARALEALDEARYASSLRWLERLVVCGVLGVEANLPRALALAGMGRTEAAIEALQRLLELRPDHARAGDMLRALGRADPGAVLARARELLEGDDAAAALREVARAKALRRPLADLDRVRALSFLRLGRPEDAREALREELRHFPENAKAQRLLEELLAGEAEEGPASHRESEFEELLLAIRPYTMVPAARLHSLYRLARQVCVDDVPGDFVECGVAAGGSSALLATVIQRYSSRPRMLHAFDSFTGMPVPTPEDTQGGLSANATGWGTGTCAAPVDSLREICGRLGVLERVRGVPGYFERTLPRERERIGEIGFLHLDGDWYESTRTILENLFDQVVPGGVVQVDDYGCWDGCRRAVHEFERKRGLELRMRPVDAHGVWIRKED